MTERKFQVGDRVRLKADQDAHLSERAMRGKESDFVAYVDSDPEFIGFALDGESSWSSSRFELVEAANVAEGATKVDAVSDATVVPANAANPFPAKVRAILSEIAETLITKNAQYGDAALNPRRIFSKLPPVEGIKLRLDDKLSRIELGDGTGDEDAVLDAMGYLVLLKIAQSEDE